MRKMAEINYKKVFAIKRANEQKILKICPDLRNESGIYAFYRIDENGFKHAYIGQASGNNLLSRAAEHLSGYQYIDISIKNHGLYDKNKNPYGYKVKAMIYCNPEECDKWEQYYIKKFHENAYQLKNTNIGGQGKGKQGLDNSRPAKTYSEGKAYGYSKAIKEISILFQKYLDVSVKKENKICNRKLQEFMELISNKENEESEEQE